MRLAPHDLDGHPRRPEIEALIRSGKRIQAIKLVREITGLGLADAKDVVDGWEGVGDAAVGGDAWGKPCAKCGHMHEPSAGKCKYCGSEVFGPLTPGAAPVSSKRAGCFACLALAPIAFAVAAWLANS